MTLVELVCVFVSLLVLGPFLLTLLYCAWLWRVTVYPQTYFCILHHIHTTHVRQCAIRACNRVLSPPPSPINASNHRQSRSGLWGWSRVGDSLIRECVSCHRVYARFAVLYCYLRASKGRKYNQAHCRLFQEGYKFDPRAHLYGRYLVEP